MLYLFLHNLYLTRCSLVFVLHSFPSSICARDSSHMFFFRQSLTPILSVTVCNAFGLHFYPTQRLQFTRASRFTQRFGRMHSLPHSFFETGMQHSFQSSTSSVPLAFAIALRRHSHPLVSVTSGCRRLGLPRGAGRRGKTFEPPRRSYLAASVFRSTDIRSSR